MLAWCVVRGAWCVVCAAGGGICSANADRAIGCVRAPAALELAPPPAPDNMDRNNTVAAFMIARGPSAMLELPVGGVRRTCSRRALLGYYNLGQYYGIDRVSTMLELPVGGARRT